MGTQCRQYAVPAELDTYMQDSIFHMLGFCACEDHLQKLSKAKEEAALNAQALKRQIADCQQLAEQHRALEDECIRLEHECALYNNDRDLFMEATYEAEDRAAEAGDRAAEAESKNEMLIEELERVRKAFAQDCRITLEMDDTKYVASLKLELEEQNSRIQVAESNLQALLQETQALRQEAALCRGNLDKAEVEVRMLADENKELRVLLRSRYAGHESPVQNKGKKGGRYLSGGRPGSKTMEGNREDSTFALCDARQPLMPLPGNSQERQLNRLQNLTVDADLCNCSPSSPCLEISPGSIFRN